MTLHSKHVSKVWANSADPRAPFVREEHRVFLHTWVRNYIPVHLKRGGRWLRGLYRPQSLDIGVRSPRDQHSTFALSPCFHSHLADVRAVFSFRTSVTQRMSYPLKPPEFPMCSQHMNVTCYKHTTLCIKYLLLPGFYIQLIYRIAKYSIYGRLNHIVVK